MNESTIDEQFDALEAAIDARYDDQSHDKFAVKRQLGHTRNVLKRVALKREVALTPQP